MAIQPRADPAYLGMHRRCLVIRKLVPSQAKAEAGLFGTRTHAAREVPNHVAGTVLPFLDKVKLLGVTVMLLAV